MASPSYAMPMPSRTASSTRRALDWPVVSAHSGLAEVAAGIGAEVGSDTAELLSFPAGDSDALRTRLAAILALTPERRHELGLNARRAVEACWSWSVVARQLLR